MRKYTPPERSREDIEYEDGVLYDAECAMRHVEDFRLALLRTRVGSDREKTLREMEDAFELLRALAEHALETLS